MPLDSKIKKVLVIGSGPIVIGQAAEFDYAGTQACRMLKEKSVKAVLVNSNPATIMTDKEMADKVYLEPLTVEVIKNIIRKEKPDSILPTLGGQTGLNMAVELAESGFLDEQNVRLLGTNVLTIKKAEDRELFKETMIKINQPVIESIITHDVNEAVNFGKEKGLPIIIRPAYTMGGTGGGNCSTMEELEQTAASGIRASRVHQILVERSVWGWKEIEFEVIRDNKGNCIQVCNMENVDPVGIHTGDSIVYAPCQTLPQRQIDMLKKASFDIVEELKICGGCNVQFALHPTTDEYYLIEVNPRVSRSSALASKATGYPIAKIATLIALGYNLDEITNGMTGKHIKGYEPQIDYLVCKFPRWPFDKFTKANKTLGTKMKATGEVMSIGYNFEETFLKALRSLELDFFSTENKVFSGMKKDELENRLSVQDDQRIFCVCESIRKGVTLAKIHEVTMIDEYFLGKLKNIVDNEEKIKKEKKKCLTKEYLLEVKKLGFSDRAIAKWCDTNEQEIRTLREGMDIKPSFREVTICAAESKNASPYIYSTYSGNYTTLARLSRQSAVVLGSGPIRIGQGVEFDYCSVHCVWSLKKAGYKTIIINNNPETVSTDFDTSDRLYFEPLTTEDVWNILAIEQPEGVVVQFGGQTAIKLAKAVDDVGYKIIGTDLKSINRAEDREEFEELLTSLNLARPQGRTIFTSDEAVACAKELGYPVLVRPSYVLGGQGMEIAYCDKDIIEYMEVININIQEHPILIDKYIMGKELEIDAICDGEDILIPGIMQHIERTGVHSGDSIAIYPAIDVNDKIGAKLQEITYKLAIGLKTKGLINIQYILRDGEIYIIEVNPRSSRTVPYISKVTGIPLVQLAISCALGKKLKDLGYGTGLYKKVGIFAVKAPVFSSEKIGDLEVSLSPEMKSTGEVLGLSESLDEALLKALIASGIRIADKGGVLITVSDNYKREAVEIADGFSRLGYDIYATAGTAHLFNLSFIPTNVVDRAGQSQNDIIKLIKSGKIQLVINTPTKGRDSNRDGFKIRRTSVEQGIACLTSMDTAGALVRALKLKKSDKDLNVISLSDLKAYKK